MNSQHILNWEYKADQYAKVTYTDEEKKKSFIEGIRWTISALEDTLNNSGHPMADKSTNAYLDKLTMRDVRRFIKEMKEKVK